MLADDRQAIELAAGFSLEWDADPERKTACVGVYRHDCDPYDRNDWQNQHKWMLLQLEALRRSFAPRIKTLGDTDNGRIGSDLEPARS